MKSPSLPGLLVCASLALGATALAHEQAKPTHDPARRHPHAAQQHSMAGHSEGSKALHRIMMQGPKMPMPMSGDVDKDFATMMTMHHRQAIAMADVLLQHGDDAELKALARKMKAAQQDEIEKLAPHTK